MTEARERTANLGAGPSMLPTPVVLEASQGFIDFQGMGMGVAEISHRSSAFLNIIHAAEGDLRKLLDIPDEYAVLFLQGGGTEQFSATVLNLLAAHAAKHSPDAPAPPIDYVLSGSWSTKAFKEGVRLAPRVNVACDMRPHAKDASRSIPTPDQWSLSNVDEHPAMLYYCDNETVDGFEFPKGFIQKLPAAYRERVPIVADCSSNILSRPIDIRAHAVVFFGAQKNVGPSGLTIAIVRRDLVVDPDAVRTTYTPVIPTTLVYKHFMDNDSLYNTPSTFPIYVSHIVFRDLLQNGGVARAEERAFARSRLVYDAIERHKQRYRAVVPHEDFRSTMNIPFRILDPATGEPDAGAEARFIALCAEHHIVQVKGHRSVGGVRASLYNASTLEHAERFARLMDEFAAN